SANRLAIGTLSAFASAPIVDRDGEMVPFSIFDSMPAEMPAAAPSSETVRSCPLRRRRTAMPISSSTLRGRRSVGASDPVASPRPLGGAERRRIVLFLRIGRLSLRLTVRKHLFSPVDRSRMGCTLPGLRWSITMCGIAGLFLKDRTLEGELGALLAGMLAPLTDRGPDSTGFAVYGESQPGVLKLTLRGPASLDVEAVLHRLGEALGRPVAHR